MTVLRRLPSLALLLPIVAGGAVLAATRASRHVEMAGVSPFDSLFTALARDSAHDIKGVLVIRDEHVVAERYFNGDDSATLHDIRSATKSITGLLAGIAIDHGVIAGT